MNVRELWGINGEYIHKGNAGYVQHEREAMLSGNTAQERIDRTITSAANAFAGLTPQGTSFAAIAKAAKVESSFIERHYKDLDGLWKAVAENLIAETGVYMKRAMNSPEAKTPDGALRALVYALVDFSAKWPQYYPIMILGERGSKIRLEWIIMESASNVFGIAKTLIEAAQKQGTARQGEAGRIYYAVVGMVMNGFALEGQYRAMTHKDPFSETEKSLIADMAIEFLGITKKG